MTLVSGGSLPVSPSPFPAFIRCVSWHGCLCISNLDSGHDHLLLKDTCCYPSYWNIVCKFHCMFLVGQQKKHSIPWHAASQICRNPSGTSSARAYKHTVFSSRSKQPTIDAAILALSAHCCYSAGSQSNSCIVVATMTSAAAAKLVAILDLPSMCTEAMADFL